MGRKRKSAVSGEKRRKKVNVTFIERKHAGKVRAPYRMMEELIAAHHSHLKNARILIFWRKGWNQDADGRLRLGTMQKASEADRHLPENPHDWKMTLNWEAFNQGLLTDEQQLLYIDHLLCHAQVTVDADGEEKVDEEGQTVYRMRKHDIEEFVDVAARHGACTHDLEVFVQRILERRDKPLLNVFEMVDEEVAEPKEKAKGKGKGKDKSGDSDKPKSNGEQAA